MYNWCSFNLCLQFCLPQMQILTDIIGCTVLGVSFLPVLLWKYSQYFEFVNMCTCGHEITLQAKLWSVVLSHTTCHEFTQFQVHSYTESEFHNYAPPIKLWKTEQNGSSFYLFKKSPKSLTQDSTFNFCLGWYHATVHVDAYFQDKCIIIIIIII